MHGLYDPEAVLRDFPGGPVVKTSPSNTGAVGSIPDWGAKISHASQWKNRTVNVVTNSVRTLKMVHVKKKKAKSPKPQN